MVDHDILIIVRNIAKYCSQFIIHVDQVILLVMKQDFLSIMTF
jgi:hypothetical protein